MEEDLKRRARKTPYGWFRSFAAKFADSDTNLAFYFIAFFFFIMVRNLVEFSTEAYYTPEANHLIHYSVAYLSIAMPLALWLHVMTGKGTLPMIKLVLPGFIVTLVPPLLDVFSDALSRGHTQYDYLIEKDPQKVWDAYLSWFGPIKERGVTLGMRIEIALATLASFFVVHAFSGKLWKAVLTALGTYTLLFFLVALPTFMLYVSRLLGLSWKVNPNDVTVFLLGWVAGFGIVLYALHKRAEFRAILRDARPLRIVHYELLFALGIALSVDPEHRNSLGFWLHAGAGAAAIALAWLAAVINNNIFDLELDRINAPERPLVTGEVDLKSYALAFWFSGALALAFGAASGPITFLAICVFLGAYVSYSSPPLRIKEDCFVSKWVIGLNSVACLVAGHALTTGLVDVPAVFAWGVLIWFSLGGHMIDIKDIEGDKAAGIRNVSTMLGLTRAKRFIGVSAVIAHLALAYFLDFSALGIFVAIAGVLQFILINRENYSDAAVLLVQNAVTLAFIVSVGLHGNPFATTTDSNTALQQPADGWGRMEGDAWANW